MLDLGDLCRCHIAERDRLCRETAIWCRWSLGRSIVHLSNKPYPLRAMPGSIISSPTSLRLTPASFCRSKISRPMKVRFGKFCHPSQSRFERRRACRRVHGRKADRLFPAAAYRARPSRPDTGRPAHRHSGERVPQTYGVVGMCSTAQIRPRRCNPCALPDSAHAATSANAK